MFEYNWATAEMAKLYLRNSRAQAKRKACKAAETAAATPGNPGLTVAGGSAGNGTGQGGTLTNLGDSDSDSDDSDSDDD